MHIVQTIVLNKLFSSYYVCIVKKNMFSPPFIKLSINRPIKAILIKERRESKMCIYLWNQRTDNQRCPEDLEKSK